MKPKARGFWLSRLLLAVAVLACIFVALFLGGREQQNNLTALDSRTLSLPDTGLVSNTSEHLLGLPSVDTNGKKETYIRLGAYDRYLDDLCSRLTNAEEDLVVAQSGGDPRVMAGLVFAHSPRAAHWLKEAFNKAPHDALVNYAILSRNDPGYDRLRSALELAKLAPQDAAPLHAAALESLIQGDRAAAISYLREAAGRDQFSSFYSEALQSEIELFKLAGRSETEARTRVYLDNNGRWEVSTALSLEKRLGLMVNYDVQPAGNEDAAPLLLDAHQKGVYGQGLDLNTYLASRGSELSYLRAFLRAESQGEGSSISRQYLNSPASELLDSATAEMKNLEPILYFYLDKPGIYQRLGDGQKAELIDRIQRDGELPAYQWAYEARPDIFNSGNFIPNGMPRDQWIEMAYTWAALQTEKK